MTVPVSRNNYTYAWTSHYAVNRNYTANGLNQYTAAGPAGFGYDANGNLAAAPGPAQNEVLTYTYDVENRLVGRTSTGASPTVTLAYDPLGRLWRVQGAAGTTRFLYDGDALAIETDGAGSVLRAFAHGPGTDEPLVWYEVPGGWRRLYPRADHQGSIVAAGGDNGALALINTYDEYGIPAGTNTGRFQYTGQIWIPELGMYHYKARVYSPTLGRFLQTDPIGYEGGINLYAYANDDPMNRADPSGWQSCPRTAGPGDCPNIPIPPREIREALRRDVVRSISRDGKERGGQAIRNNQTGVITNRTGSEAGRPGIGEFVHKPAPPGSTTILRSHEHKPNRQTGESGVSFHSSRRENDAPGTLDQRAMHLNNRPIQTIGPNLTTTMGRRDRQDILVIDHGDRAMLPNLSSQQIIVIDE